MNVSRTRFSGPLWTLATKELRQIFRDRRLVMTLVVAPVLQLLLFGSVLNANVSDVSLGVVDQSRTPESRELVAELTQSRAFRLGGYYGTADRLGDALSRGGVDAGVVIPYHFAADLVRGRPATVQFLLNATNVNTAQISRAYARGVIQAYNAGLAARGVHAVFAQIAAPPVSGQGTVQLDPAFLFNPGLVSSWFMTTGLLGLLLILNGTIISSTVMLREREFGTIEQLLMSPASTAEIILAKFVPLSLLLTAMAVGALGLMRAVFGVPFHGTLALVLGGAVLCLLVGVGLGTMLSTFARSAAQAFLMVFFINPPLVSLSGAFMPVEAMPKWLQPLTVLNPIYQFSQIARGVLIKGVGFESVWPNFLALLILTTTLLALSVWRFRRQLE